MNFDQRSKIDCSVSRCYSVAMDEIDDDLRYIKKTLSKFGDTFVLYCIMYSIQALNEFVVFKVLEC